MDLENKNFIVSEALFSFNLILEICLNLAKYDKEEATAYFKKLLIFIVDCYLSLTNSDIDKVQNLEEKVKVSELRSFINSVIIERIFINFVQVSGSNEVTKVQLRTNIDY